MSRTSSLSDKMSVRQTRSAIVFVGQRPSRPRKRVKTMKARTIGAECIIESRRLEKEQNSWYIRAFDENGQKYRARIGLFINLHYILHYVTRASDCTKRTLMSVYLARNSRVRGAKSSTDAEYVGATAASGDKNKRERPARIHKNRKWGGLPKSIDRSQSAAENFMPAD